MYELLVAVGSTPNMNMMISPLESLKMPPLMPVKSHFSPRPLHTGGSGSPARTARTSLSPRVLGFQVGDILAVDISVGEVS